MATTITGSSISNVGTPSAWFTPAGMQFTVDIDVGDVIILTRRDSSDSVPKALAMIEQPRVSRVLSGPCSISVMVASAGRQYQLKPVSATATAQAQE